MQISSLLILNGPDDAPVEQACAQRCAAHGIAMTFYRGDAAAHLDAWVKTPGAYDALIVNSNTDADRAAIVVAAAALKRPIVEAYAANIFRDGAIEPLHTPNAPIALVSGLGAHGYLLAIDALARKSGADAPARARKKVRVLNGPNLNLLGQREPEIYGATTLAQIVDAGVKAGAERGLDVEFLQSNHEGRLVDWIQTAIGACDALIINAGAYTHTSIALHDALRAFKGYKIELHISNPHLRETFRHISFLAPAVDAVIAGFGPVGYNLAIQHLPALLEQR